MTTTADSPDAFPQATATAPLPAARALDATKIYGSGDTRVIALDDVTVELPGGRFTAIMGPSGSGVVVIDPSNRASGSLPPSGCG